MLQSVFIYIFNKKKYYTYNAQFIACKCYSTFIELGDATLVKKRLEFKPQLTPKEQMILNLLDNPKSKVKTK